MSAYLIEGFSVRLGCTVYFWLISAGLSQGSYVPLQLPTMFSTSISIPTSKDEFIQPLYRGSYCICASAFLLSYPMWISCLAFVYPEWSVFLRTSKERKSMKKLFVNILVLSIPSRLLSWAVLNYLMSCLRGVERESWIHAAWTALSCVHHFVY